MDGLSVMILLALMFSNKNNDNNRINYLDNYEKYGDDENV